MLVRILRRFRLTIDIDECAINNPCGLQASCTTSSVGSRQCSCYPGFHFKSLGTTGISVSKLYLAKVISGNIPWNSEDDCIANMNCEYFFDSPPSGKFGCGSITYSGSVTPLIEDLLTLLSCQRVFQRLLAELAPVQSAITSLVLANPDIFLILSFSLVVSVCLAMRNSDRFS